MSLFTLSFAGCLALALVAWHLCGRIEGAQPRALARAILVGLLCAPGVLVGHGIGVLPGIVALGLQPSPFSLGPVAVVAALTYVLIMKTPRLRDAAGSTGLSLAAVFAPAWAMKLFVLGVVATVLFQSGLLLRLSLHDGFVVVHLLFLGLMYLHFAICRAVASSESSARQWLLPLPLAVPMALMGWSALAAGAFMVLLRPALLYLAGMAGVAAARGRRGVVAVLVVLVHLLYAAYLLYLAQYASNLTGASHVAGGVWGNLMAAAGTVVLGAIVTWFATRRTPPLEPA